MEQERHIETEEARSAVTNHNVRYVLAISLAAAIVILSLVWMTGAFTSQ